MTMNEGAICRCCHCSSCQHLLQQQSGQIAAKLNLSKSKSQKSPGKFTLSEKYRHRQKSPAIWIVATSLVVLFSLFSLGSTLPFEASNEPNELLLGNTNGHHSLVRRSVSLRRSASTASGVLVRAPYSNWWQDWWKTYISPLRDSHEKPFIASPSSISPASYASSASLQLIDTSNGVVFDPAETVVSVTHFRFNTINTRHTRNSHSA